MNWGKAIVIVLAGFAVFIVSLVVLMYRQNIDLVADDYYMQELEFQQKIDRSNNLAALDGKLKVTFEGSKMLINLPEVLHGVSVSGKISMYRPSNAIFDFSEHFENITTGQIPLDVSKALKGKWEVKLDFVAEGVEYYFTEKLYLQ
jgi:hypothetical protein